MLTMFAEWFGEVWLSVPVWVLVRVPGLVRFMTNMLCFPQKPIWSSPISISGKKRIENEADVNFVRVAMLLSLVCRPKAIYGTTLLARTLKKQGSEYKISGSHLRIKVGKGIVR